MRGFDMIEDVQWHIDDLRSKAAYQRLMKQAAQTPQTPRQPLAGLRRLIPKVRLSAIVSVNTSAELVQTDCLTCALAK